MIDVNVISSAVTAGQGSMQIAATMVEPLVFGATNTDPQFSISFSNGTPFLSGVNVLIPMTATIEAKYINSKGVLYRTQILTEQFTVGYTNSSLPTSVAVTTNNSVTSLSSNRCCKSYQLTVQGSVGIVIV